MTEQNCIGKGRLEISVGFGKDCCQLGMGCRQEWEEGVSWFNRM